MKSSYLLIISFFCFSIFGCSNAQSNSKKADSLNQEKMTKNWKEELDEETYRVTRLKGTERPFSGKYWNLNGKGEYLCVCCKTPLFKSSTKFDAGCGWPSFYDAVDEKKINLVEDRSHGMIRTEVLCAKCDAHLGHLFDDGPQPTGMRYCINSVSIDFKAETDEKNNTLKEATFGAGCFWCIEACFKDLNGVVSVKSGYSGGKTKNPTYEEVCSETTGHVEVARIVYDETKITYDELLEAFWFVHDPTQINGQGNDIGTRYRTVIFYHDSEQKHLAEKYKQKLTDEKVWDKPIATQIEKLSNFYPAEAYHDNYFERNPQNMYCQAVVRPKVEKFRKVFGKKLK